MNYLPGLVSYLSFFFLLHTILNKYAKAISCPIIRKNIGNTIEKLYFVDKVVIKIKANNIKVCIII
jgi:hypothetical protein